MKKPVAVTTVLAVAAALVCNCSDNDGETNPSGINPPGTNPPASTGQGADSLASLCEGGTCNVDSGQSYTKTGTQVTLRADSADTSGLSLNFTTVNDSQAVAVLDTTVIPPEMGSAQLVFERVTGSGTNLEDELWRLDSLRISIDTLGIDASVPLPGDQYLVLDSETGEVLSTLDTTGLTQQIAVAAVAACPLPYLQAAQGIPLAAFIIPVDSIDVSRSTCDTTWGFNSQGQEVYVTSNDADSLFFYSGTTNTQTGAVDLDALVGLMLPLILQMMAQQPTQ